MDMEFKAPAKALDLRYPGPDGRPSSTNTTMATTKASPFDEVPNEVLDLIISSIHNLHLSKVIYRKDGSSCQVHQMIALMHVSRQFRFVMLHHQVWRMANFDFISLVATIRGYSGLFPKLTNAKALPTLPPTFAVGRQDSATRCSPIQFSSRV
jgi:hypothetical protein